MSKSLQRDTPHGEKLLECPFCGAVPPNLISDFVPNTQGNRKFIRCLECHAQGPWSTKAINEEDGWDCRRGSASKQDETPETDHALEMARRVSTDDDNFFRAATGLLEALCRKLERRSILGVAGSCSSEDIPAAIASGALSKFSAPATYSDGWIACAERMPEEGYQTVLATDGEVISTGFHGMLGWKLDAAHESDPTITPTHWMPLPEAPHV